MAECFNFIIKNCKVANNKNNLNLNFFIHQTDQLGNGTDTNVKKGNVLEKIIKYTIAHCDSILK